MEATRGTITQYKGVTDDGTVVVVTITVVVRSGVEPKTYELNDDGVFAIEVSGRRKRMAHRCRRAKDMLACLMSGSPAKRPRVSDEVIWNALFGTSPADDTKLVNNKRVVHHAASEIGKIFTADGHKDIRDYGGGYEIELGDFNIIVAALPTPVANSSPSAVITETDKTLQSSRPTGLTEPLGEIIGDVPERPQHYIERPELFSAIKAELIGSERQVVSIDGMAGSGKSVIAAELIRDEDVRRHFAGGVIWCKLGRAPDIFGHIMSIVEAVSDEDQQVKDLEAAKRRLTTLTQAPRLLIVLDDARDSEHIRPFKAVGGKCKILITTQNRAIGGGREDDRLKLSAEDARRLLANVLRADDIPSLGNAILKECGYLPLAIAMVGSVLTGHDHDRWARVLARLTKHDIRDVVDTAALGYEHKTLMLALQASVDLVNDEVKRRYETLAVLPEGTSVSISLIESYWSSLGPCAYSPLAALKLLANHHLVIETHAGGIGLHDVHQHYVKSRALDDGSDQLLHTQFGETVRKLRNSKEADERTSWYCHAFLAHHLARSGRTEEATNVAEEVLLSKADVPNSARLQNLRVLNEFGSVDAVGTPLIKLVNKMPDVVATYLRLAGERALDDAQWLIDRVDDEAVLCICIDILGGRAKPAALRLLGDERKPGRTNHGNVLAACITLLADEAAPAARRLLGYRGKSPHPADAVISRCLLGLRDEPTAKRVADRILAEIGSGDDLNRHDVICRSLFVLGTEAEHHARSLRNILVKEPHTHAEVFGACMKATRADDETRALAAEMLGDHLNEGTTRHLQYMQTCVNVLKNDAKPAARRLIGDEGIVTVTYKNGELLRSCMQLLRTEAAAQSLARRCIGRWASIPPRMVFASFGVLDGASRARPTASQMLRRWNQLSILNRISALLWAEPCEEKTNICRSVLWDWYQSDRPLVAAALSNFADAPQDVAGICKEILNSWHRHVSVARWRLMRCYVWHVICAASNPHLRAESAIAAQEMLAVERGNPGFVPPMLIMAANDIVANPSVLKWPGDISRYRDDTGDN